MTNIPIDYGRGPSLTLEAEVVLALDIDPANLGRHVAGLLSTEQAQIIFGFYEAVDDGQLLHIGTERAFDGEREHVAGVLRTLADAIEQGGGR